MSIERLLGVPTASRDRSRAMSFSILFFSDTRMDLSSGEKYGFLRDLTLFADREGFEAIYLPERHFQPFGALFPNSAVLAAYLIPQTQRIRIRTAGISLPLHHPTEVVEAWAMNDVLSGGRVDLGFGSGWARADFILAPDNYERRRDVMAERIDIVRRLWRGDSVKFRGPGGEEVGVNVYPRPVQKDLRVWMLVAQNPESFEYAGHHGFNVFTMLYGYDLEALQEKIRRYRTAWREAGHGPAGGVVTLMLHTLLGTGLPEVERVVEKPFKEYIWSSLGPHLAARASEAGVGVVQGPAEQAKVLEYAYQRYVRTCALFGSVEEAERVVARAKDVGVDEIACVLDFGVDRAAVEASLPHLKTLVSRHSGRP